MVTQQLTLLGALAKNLNLVPSIHAGQFTATSIAAQGDIASPAGFHGYCTHVYTHVTHHTNIQKEKAETKQEWIQWNTQNTRLRVNGFLDAFWEDDFYILRSNVSGK